MTAIVVVGRGPAPPRRGPGALRSVAAGGGLRPLGIGPSRAQRERRPTRHHLRLWGEQRGRGGGGRGARSRRRDHRPPPSAGRPAARRGGGGSAPAGLRLPGRRPDRCRAFLQARRSAPCAAWAPDRRPRGRGRHRHHRRHGADDRREPRDRQARAGRAGSHLTRRASRSCWRAPASTRQPTARDLAFGVVPRINAAGRIADAEVAMSLLLETDPTRAEAMADDSSWSMNGGGRCRRWRSTPLVCWQRRSPARHRSSSATTPGRPACWGSSQAGLPTTWRVRWSPPPSWVTRYAARCAHRSTFTWRRRSRPCAAHLTKRGATQRQVDSARFPRRGRRLRTRSAPSNGRFGAGLDVEVQHPGRQLVDLVLPSRYLGWELADELGRLAPYGPGHLEPVLAVTGLRVGERPPDRRARDPHLIPHAARDRVRRRDRLRHGRRPFSSRGGSAGRPRRHAGARHVRWHGAPAAARARLRRCDRQPAARPPTVPLELARAG